MKKCIEISLTTNKSSVYLKEDKTSLILYWMVYLFPVTKKHNFQRYIVNAVAFKVKFKPFFRKILKFRIECRYSKYFLLEKVAVSFFFRSKSTVWKSKTWLNEKSALTWSSMKNGPSEWFKFEQSSKPRTKPAAFWRFFVTIVDIVVSVTACSHLAVGDGAAGHSQTARFNCDFWCEFSFTGST